MSTNCFEQTLQATYNYSLMQITSTKIIPGQVPAMSNPAPRSRPPTIKGRNPRFIKEPILLIQLRTFERVDLKQQSTENESAPNVQRKAIQILVAEAVRNNFSITKRCIIIWSWITEGSITLALFITKPKTTPTKELIRYPIGDFGVKQSIRSFTTFNSTHKSIINKKMKNSPKRYQLLSIELIKSSEPLAFSFSFISQKKYEQICIIGEGRVSRFTISSTEMELFICFCILFILYPCSSTELAFPSVVKATYKTIAHQVPAVRNILTPLSLVSGIYLS